MYGPTASTSLWMIVRVLLLTCSATAARTGASRLTVGMLSRRMILYGGVAASRRPASSIMPIALITCSDSSAFGRFRSKRSLAFWVTLTRACRLLGKSSAPRALSVKRLNICVVRITATTNFVNSWETIPTVWLRYALPSSKVTQTALS